MTKISLKAVPAIILMINLTGCPSSKTPEIPPPLVLDTADMNYDITEVKRGDISEKIEIRGDFVSREQIALNFGSVEGYLKDIYVYNGKSVQEGDLLAELDSDILDLQYDLELLALERAKLIYLKETGPQVSEEDRLLALYRLNEQIHKTEEAEYHQSLAQLRAPADGEIVFLNNQYDPGDYIPPRTTLMEMAEPGNLEIRYRGRYVKSFHYGLRVEYRIPVGVNRGKTFQAEVVQTSKETPRNEEANSLGEVYFRTIGEEPSEVRRGESCNITYTIVQKKNVLLLPEDLIETRHDGSYVVLLNDQHRSVTRMVSTGIKDSGMVEITGGLEEGYLVLRR